MHNDTVHNLLLIFEYKANLFSRIFLFQFCSERKQYNSYVIKLSAMPLNTTKTWQMLFICEVITIEYNKVTVL